MKLNKNSISAKLFRWFYSTRKLPTNLCPYFWKLVVAYIFALPLFVISLPYAILEKDLSQESVGTRIGLGILCWTTISLLIAALSPISLFWHIPEKDSNLFHLICCGFAVWAVSLVLGILFLIDKIKEKLKERKYEMRNIPKREKRPNIIVEMARAIYYKYCPKIDWN